MKDYEVIEQHIPDGGRHYAIIMTPNHKADKQVPKRLLDKKIRYLGMMGSAKKVGEIFHRLQDVHAHIGDHTPAEIAVSIAAEMVSLRWSAQ